MAYTLRLLTAALLLSAAGVASASLAAGESLQLMPVGREPANLLVPPAAARGSFLLYQLAAAINSAGLGLEVEQEHEQELVLEQAVDSSWLNAMPNEFQAPIYEEFPLQLQTWLTDGYGLTVEDFYQGWRSARIGQAQQLCNGWGQCFEVADIVAACCPF